MLDIIGCELWLLPEFEALARKLGVDLDKPTVCLTIEIPWLAPVTVTHETFVRPKAPGGTGEQ